MATTAEKLRLIPQNKKYNELLAKFRKLSKGNQFYFQIPYLELDPYTHNKLKSNGFTIENSEFNGFSTFKITW